MAVEIERKFLVVGEGWKAGVVASKEMRQGYLSVTGPASVRVRIDDDISATLTVKSRREGIERLEFEYAIPVLDAEALLEMVAGQVIAKRRHIVPVTGSQLVWEVDVFENRLTGLVLAEIELDRADREIALPGWIGREVTQDRGFYNEQLATLKDLSVLSLDGP